MSRCRADASFFLCGLVKPAEWRMEEERIWLNIHKNRRLPRLPPTMFWKWMALQTNQLVCLVWLLGILDLKRSEEGGPRPGRASSKCGGQGLSHCLSSVRATRRDQRACGEVWGELPKHEAVENSEQVGRLGGWEKYDGLKRKEKRMEDKKTTCNYIVLLCSFQKWMRSVSVYVACSNWPNRWWLFHSICISKWESAQSTYDSASLQGPEDSEGVKEGLESEDRLGT